VPAAGRAAEIETEVEGHAVVVVGAQMAGTLTEGLHGDRAPEGRPELGMEPERGLMVAGGHGRHQLPNAFVSCWHSAVLRRGCDKEAGSAMMSQAVEI
jgi:hypothetical protein